MNIKEVIFKHYTDPTDYQYACEIWDSMTEDERMRCTLKDMDAYVQDTYAAVKEMEE